MSGDDHLSQKIDQLGIELRVRDENHAAALGGIKRELSDLRENQHRLHETVQRHETVLGDGGARMRRASDRARAAQESTSELDLRMESLAGSMIAHVSGLEKEIAAVRQDTAALKKGTADQNTELAAQTGMLVAAKSMLETLRPMKTAIAGFVGAAGAAFVIELFHAAMHALGH